MARNRVFLVFKIVIMAVIGSSLTGCGSTATPSLVTPHTTASQRLDTGPLGLPLYCPGYLTHDQQGNIYIGDSDEGRQNSHRARIVKLSPAGQLLSEWHVFSAFPQGPSGPYGLAVDASGTVYIADAGDNTIKKFSSTGTLLASWGKTGSAPGEFSWPEGVALDAEDNVYVADFHNSRIQKFSSTGTLLAVWGNTNSSPERLNGPVGVEVDGQGNVYVADIRNHRIVKFSSEGKFLAAWGQASSVSFSSAKDIAADREGNIYIADDRNDRIVKLSPTGKVITIWKNQMASGMFGITVDSQGNIYFAEYAAKGGVRKLAPGGAVLATWPATCIPPP